MVLSLDNLLLPRIERSFCHLWPTQSYQMQLIPETFIQFYKINWLSEPNEVCSTQLSYKESRVPVNREKGKILASFITENHFISAGWYSRDA